MPPSTQTTAHSSLIRADLPAFQAGYLILSLIVAGMFTMGMFAVFIAAWFAVSLLKNTLLHKKLTIGYSLREILLSTTLLVAGLAVSVYLDDFIGLTSSLTGPAHAYTTLLRGLMLVALKVQILHMVLGMFSVIDSYVRSPSEYANVPLSSREGTTFLVLLIAVAAIVFSPIVLSMDVASLQEILREQLVIGVV